MSRHDHNDRSTPSRQSHRYAASVTPASPSPPTVLTPAHVLEALAKSPDDGATLDFTHLNLSDVGEEGAEELATIGREGGADEESSVIRIALSYNRLATLPTTFALLSRVRYLNLRNNSFSVFPHVLTIMPSLEILDIRRNKIKRFPSHPGSLVNLRVLSMSRNKVTRLPVYFGELRRLETLGIDHNPIEWPPKSVLEPFVDSSDKAGVREWIRMIQAWVGQQGVHTSGRKGSDDSLLSEGRDWEFSGLDSYGVEAPMFGHEPDFEMVVTPHSRARSMSSDGSAYSDRRAPSPAKSRASARREASPRPPPLQLGLLSTPTSYSTGTSAAASPDSYLPTPDDSVGSVEDQIQHGSELGQQVHGRNASFAPGYRATPRSNLSAKKSLPDLRTARFPFGASARQRSHTEDVQDSAVGALPRPPPPRQDTASSDDVLASTTFENGYTASSPTAAEMPGPSVGVERNSYFRRLSTISSSTVHKAIPQALLDVVEGVRDVMFAVTQIYQTLEHYAQCAASATLSSVLKKVLDPASMYVTRVIGALDRFDHTSRKSLPGPAVCRAVIEGCKDMVAGFGKAVDLLFAQLKVIAMNEDRRYTRQMLLVLYGSTAEIARAWSHILPRLEAVRPLLHESHRRPPPSKSRAAAALASSRAEGMESPGEPPASAPPTSSPFLPQPVLTPILRSRSTYVAERGSARKARRQAGSFSVKDVEIGREMATVVESPPLPSVPSPTASTSQTPTPRATMVVATPSPPAPRPLPIGPSVTPPPLLSPPLSQTPTPRSILPGSLAAAIPSPASATSLPKNAWPPGYVMSPLSAAAMSPSWNNVHSRQGSQSSQTASSSAASSALMPTSSSTLADKDAIVAVENAVEAAPPVWEMMEGLVDELGGTAQEVREGLERAKAVTARLKQRLANVKDGEFVGNRQALREDAQIFIKIVVQLSNSMKTYNGSRIPSLVVRAKMVKLTNATEACLMLLHVSSFSASASRPYSPYSPTAGSAATSSPVVEDGKLAASLARSRSTAVQPMSVRSPISGWRDGPRSALPHQQAFRFGAPSRAGHLPRTPAASGAGSHF